MISQLKNITKRYKRGKRCFEVFKEFNLSVEKQELLVLSGRSGSGKSTLLALAGGYLKPDEGEITFDGQIISSLQDKELSGIHANRIGYLPQSNVMVSEFTILENVMLKSLVLGEKSDKDKALEILNRFEIASLAEQFPYELSGGELRRASIARLLLSEPELYLIDEPTGGLDKKMTHIVMQSLQECIKNGATVIVATHDDLVKEYGSRVLELE